LELKEFVMALKEEINELFNLINNHTDEVEYLNFFIRMKNGTIFKYKMDKKKEFRIKLKEELQKMKQNKKREKEKPAL
jgi:hypothetical protein